MVPREGRVLGEMDFSGAEISTSCVTIDTIIDTVHGSITMGALLNRLKVGKKTYVYSYSREKGRICVSEVTSGGITGKNKEVFKVTLDNGDVIKATPDHKFMKRDGVYSELKDLVVGDSLMPLHKEAKRRACDAVSYEDIYLNNGSHILAHNLIAEDLYGITIKGSKLLVHHRDGNGLNNDPDNLEVMTRKKHMRIHSIQGWKNKPAGTRKIDRAALSVRAVELNRKRKAEWTQSDWDEFSQRISEGIQSKNNGNRGMSNSMYGKTQSQKCRDAVSKANTGRIPWCKGKKLGPISDAHREAISVPCTEERRVKIQAALKGKTFTEEHKQALRGIPKTEEHRSKIGNAKKKWWADKALERCHICNREFKSVTNSHLKTHGISLKEYIKVHNHKIVSIEQCASEDVYNINVAGTHNYSANGVIIKNCYYHKDPTFIEYQTEGGGDMHRDGCAEILKIKPEEVPDEARQATKGIWTFSQFFGSYYATCAKQGWEEFPELVDYKTGEILKINGIPIDEHMRKTFPTYQSFENHLKVFEKKFWHQWFPVYTAWKGKEADKYIKQGYTETFLGFRFKGKMDTKTCSNYPIQGTSFHLLLYTAVQFGIKVKELGLKTLLIGQVHDSLILDMPLDEVKTVYNVLMDIVTNLHKTFLWMDFPMQMDFEMTDSYEQGGTFAKMYKADDWFDKYQEAA